MAPIGGALRLQILGPLRIWRDSVELEVGPRQQAYLLAVLLANAGRPTSMSELVDLVWADDVPVSAANILQKYVGALRRLLEPTLPARASGSYLRRHGSGYVFAADPGGLDIALFRQLVGTAEAGAAEERPDAALDSYVRALGLWHGSAGEGLTHGPAGMSVFASLDAEFLDAGKAAADLAVARGQPGRVLPSLRLAARMAPLHEGVQASLATALAAAGQSAEALSLLRTVRARLAAELGIDPGPALVDAYQRVLGSAAHDEPARRPRPWAAEPPRSTHLIGRAEDLAVLRRTVETALAGHAGLALVDGEPGVGKTGLLEEIAAEADRHGALVAWVRCLEGDGAPAMWPWTQAVVDTLSPEQCHAGEPGPLLSSAGDDLPHRFRLFEQVVELVGRVSARRPVVLLVDDLQWADAASVDLFGHLVTRLPKSTAVIGALRSCAPTPGPELRRVLAVAGRLPIHRRIRLGPLGASEVAELLRRETGEHPSSRVTRQILARTGGNPFFVRELSRLLVAGDVRTEVGAGRPAVPATVQDVVRGRVAVLADADQGLLRLAALIGCEFEIPLLAGSAGLDVETCLGRLESLEGLGLIEPSPGNPYSYRFTHDLVRESLAGLMSPSQAARLHLRIGDALEHTGPRDETAVERLACHLWSAGPIADPARTVATLVRAGRRAAARAECDAAARHLRKAARVARTAGVPAGTWAMLGVLRYPGAPVADGCVVGI